MKFLRFLVVGGLNTLLGVAVYGALLLAGLPFFAASAVSLFLGILVGFRAHAAFVFRTPGRIWRYAAVWLAVYLLSTGLIGLLAPGMGPLIAGVAAMPVNAVAAFFLLRRFVFADSSAGVSTN